LMGSKCGIYGDCIEDLDGSVGRVLETPDRLKLTRTPSSAYQR
jgi:hypothetical protein